MLKPLLTVALGLTLVGCASLPTPKSEAIHFALLQDATLRELASQCSALGAAQQSLAVQAERDWWQRNGNSVMAADYGLLQLNWDQAAEAAEQQRAFWSMQVLERIQIDSREQVDDWLSGNRAERNCEQQLTAFRDGRNDLSRERKYFETLVTLQNERRALATDVDQAVSINARYRRYGRSLFVVEQHMTRQGCSQPEIALLRNAWPLEVYDAVCSDQSYYLIQCEWGRCDVKP